MNNLLSQKWCLCLNVQNRIKLCRPKNHKFGDDTTVCKQMQYKCYCKCKYNQCIYTLCTYVYDVCSKVAACTDSM